MMSYEEGVCMPAVVTSSDSWLALMDGPRGREIGVEIKLIAMGAGGGKDDDVGDDVDVDDESAVEDVDVERVEEDDVNGVV